MWPEGRTLAFLCAHTDEKKTKINETENDVAEAEALVRARGSVPDSGDSSFPCEPPELTELKRRFWRLQVRRMDLEARSLPAGVKTPLLNKLKDYKVRIGRFHDIVESLPRVLDSLRSVRALRVVPYDDAE